MKKILCISFAALLLFAGVAYAVDYGQTVTLGSGNQPSSGHKQGHGAGEIMGQGKYDSEPHRTFRFVRYVPPQPSSTTGTGDHLLDYVVSKDSVVIWETAVSGDDGVTVTLTTTSLFLYTKEGIAVLSFVNSRIASQASETS